MLLCRGAGFVAPALRLHSRYAAQGTPENYEDFLRAFLGSQLGVILTGIPQSVSGEHKAGKNELQAAMSTAPDGHGHEWYHWLTGRLAEHKSGRSIVRLQNTH